LEISAPFDAPWLMASLPDEITREIRTAEFESAKRQYRSRYLRFDASGSEMVLTGEHQA